MRAVSPQTQRTYLRQCKTLLPDGCLVGETCVDFDKISRKASMFFGYLMRPDQLSVDLNIGVDLRCSRHARLSP